MQTDADQQAVPPRLPEGVDAEQRPPEHRVGRDLLGGPVLLEVTLGGHLMQFFRETAFLLQVEAACQGRQQARGRRDQHRGPPGQGRQIPPVVLGRQGHPVARVAQGRGQAKGQGHIADQFGQGGGATLDRQGVIGKGRQGFGTQADQGGHFSNQPSKRAPMAWAAA